MACTVRVMVLMKKLFSTCLASVYIDLYKKAREILVLLKCNSRNHCCPVSSWRTALVILLCLQSPKALRNTE